MALNVWRWLGATAVIAAVPVAALLALLARGAVQPAAGGLALLACLLAALLLARHWLRSLLALQGALERASLDAGGPAPALPRPVAEVAEGIARLGRMLHTERALAARLRRADAAILEALPDPLLVLSPDRSLLRANAATRALFGGTAEAELAGLLRHPALAEALERALALEQPQAVDLALPVPGREIAAQVIPLDPPLADGGRLVVVLSDRTRERAVERMRADFVANASHELRTPLASLIGFIDTLRGPAEDDPPARARFLGIMAEQSERMRRLIDDLLGLSRIEVNEHQAPTGSADLAAILQAEAAALAPIVAARGARLEIAAAPATAAPADAEQLAQVVRNLLENALRHGREGGVVEASCGAAAGPGGRDGVRLVVQDDGPGIPKHHIPRLTERFYRVDKGRSRSAGGTGLGLAIVKHIVARHRGRLLIESEEGQGARFTVWLPAGG